MKKIIYSLVIMIAAGSLFTSCVNYDEPVGVQDLREAKASYLDALSGLRAADAEVQKSIAALYNAQAEMEKANAAYRNAEVEYQKLVNDSLATQNAQQKANAEKAIAQARADAEKAAVNNAKALAKAQAAFEKELKKIEAEALALTEAERTALQSAINNYYAALKTVNDKADTVAEKERDLWAAKYGYVEGGKNLTKDEFIAAQQDSIAKYTAVAKQWTGYKEALSKNEDFEQWKSYMSTLAAEKAADQYDSLTLAAQEIALKATTLKDNLAAAKEAWETWEEANKPDVANQQTVTYNEDGKLTPEIAANTNWFETLVNGYALACFPGATNIWTMIGSTTDQVEKFLNGSENGTGLEKSGFNGVIEVIKNSKLVEADTTNATVLAELKEAYEVADSTYKADLDTLKKGLAAYMALDSLYGPAVDDTVKANAQYQLDTAALTVATNKKSAAETADKNAVNALIASRNALAKVDSAFKANIAKPTNYSKTFDKEYIDTLYDAIKDFAAKKVAVFGEQKADKIGYLKANDLTVDSVFTAIKDLTKADFVQTVDSVKVVNNVGTKTVSFKVSNPLSKIVRVSSTLYETINRINSYEVKYTYTTENASLQATADWEPYTAASGVNGFILPNEVIAAAKYSVPADNEVMQDAFSIVFNALGLNLDYTGSFWANWGKLLRENLNNYAVIDPMFQFTLDGFAKKVGVTNNDPQKYIYKLYVEDPANTWPAYTPAASKAAADSVTAALKKINNATKPYGSAVVLEKEKDTLNTVIAKNINNFAKVYNNFFGLTAPSSGAWNTTTWGAQHIAPHFNTYFDEDGEPNGLAEKIEKFEFCKEKIDPYAVYEVVLSSLNFNTENSAYQDVIKSLLAQYTGLTTIEVKALVFGNDVPSEYDKMKAAFYAYEIAKNQPDIVKYFEAVQAWAKGLEAELAKVVAANEEYNELVAAYEEAAFGFEVEDGDTTAKATVLNIANQTDIDILSVDAEELDGQELAIYNEYLAETIEQIKEIEAEKAKLNARVVAITNLINQLNSAFAPIVNTVTGENTVAANDSFAEACRKIYEYIDGNITSAQDKIDSFQYTIDRINAGASVRVANEEAAEKALALAKEDLAFAEKLLAVAKAEYEAAIAKYVK